MNFKRRIGLPFALLATLLNLVAGVYAAVTLEPMHAFTHGAIAFGFGLLAAWFWVSGRRAEASIARPDKVEMLEADLSELERELHETQQRLDFADQLLRKRPPSGPDDLQPLKDD